MSIHQMLASLLVCMEGRVSPRLVYAFYVCDDLNVYS